MGVILTDVGLILCNSCHQIVIEGLAHELLRDLPGAEMVELLRQVDGGALANLEDIPDKPLELGVNDGSVDGQQTRSNLGRERLASADEAIAEGRGCAVCRCISV